jgi:hypothetical protein
VLSGRGRGSSSSNGNSNSNGNGNGNGSRTTHQALEGQLEQQQIGRLLVSADLTQRNRAWMVAVLALRRGAWLPESLGRLSARAGACAAAA